MTDTLEAIWLAALFLVVALIYASVGQAGASGYIAVMGLFGMAPVAMKTTALVLNLLVAGIGTLQFWWAGRLSGRRSTPSRFWASRSRCWAARSICRRAYTILWWGPCSCSRPS